MAAVKLQNKHTSECRVLMRSTPASNLGDCFKSRPWHRLFRLKISMVLSSAPPAQFLDSTSRYLTVTTFHILQNL